VLCVENNRVILANGRYIHANWIEANGERRFICTQGPLSQTVDDFWALVLQEKIEAVVMLCNTLELNRPKCVQYWPEDNSPNSVSLRASILIIFLKSTLQVIQSEDGNIRVEFIAQEPLDTHLIKTRLLVTSNNPKQQQVVRHFHWRDWPDRGVPINQLATLRLLHFLGPYQRIIVHCSAGGFS
jgi:protein tyrosine phosphatase